VQLNIEKIFHLIKNKFTEGLISSLTDYSNENLMKIEKFALISEQYNKAESINFLNVLQNNTEFNLFQSLNLNDLETLCESITNSKNS
jgi:hypothetical protein